MPLKRTLEVLSARLDAAENERMKVLAQMQGLIVEKFDKYKGQIAVRNSNITRRNEAVSKYVKAHTSYANVRNSGNARKIEAARAALQAEEASLRSAEDLLNRDASDFEYQRLSELKEMLRRWIHDQMYFHAKSMEGLTAAYKECAKIDPEKERAMFLRRIRELEFQDVQRRGGQLQPQPQSQPAASASALVSNVGLAQSQSQTLPQSSQGPQYQQGQYPQQQQPQPQQQQQFQAQQYQQQYPQQQQPLSSPTASTSAQLSQQQQAAGAQPSMSRAGSRLQTPMQSPMATMTPAGAQR